ncbi:MAG: YbhB/YbcL family Raf kinase inhibitor-like protein [Deltaproteobacteria bacterium]
MKLLSPSFADKARIPSVYTMPAVGGKNVSPALTWSGLPDGTKSLALLVVDPHPVARNWVHWLVVDIPPHIRELPEGASGRSMPNGARELINSFGNRGYGGPQPPTGTGDHPYVFTLYALSVAQIDIGPRPSAKDFHEAIQGHVLASATLTGYFGR